MVRFAVFVLAVSHVDGTTTLKPSTDQAVLPNSPHGGAGQQIIADDNVLSRTKTADSYAAEPVPPNKSSESSSVETKQLPPGRVGPPPTLVPSK